MKITTQLLEKYAQDLCNSEEKAAVEVWMNSLEVETEFPEHTNIEQIQDRMWAYVSQSAPDLKKGRIVSIQEWAKTYYRLAAVAVLMLSSSIGIYLFVSHSRTQQVTLRVQEKTIRTGKGERLKVQLSDGTSIYLNSDSELRYPDSFSDSVRRISLVGEGYFQVAKNPAQPFIVHTKHTLTRVVGTAFNLQAYPEQASTSVVVEEGKVKFARISDPSHALLLTANMRGICSENGAEKDKVMPSKFFAWKDNVLVFDNTPLEDVATQLERFYGTKVLIKETENHLSRYTGKFNNKSLKQTVEGISYSMKFRYTLTDTLLTIY